MSNEMEKTHVRYTVEYNGRNYEHPLHSNKRYFIKNIADVVNILEYCIMQELKKDQTLYRNEEKLYNFNVVRLVNDKVDTTVDAKSNSMEFNDLMTRIATRIVNDNRVRYSA